MANKRPFNVEQAISEDRIIKAQRAALAAAKRQQDVEFIASHIAKINAIQEAGNKLHTLEAQHVGAETGLTATEPIAEISRANLKSTKLRPNRRIIQEEEEYVPESPVYIPPSDFIDLTIDDDEDIIEITTEPVSVKEEPIKKISHPINAPAPAPVVQAITVATEVQAVPITVATEVQAVVETADVCIQVDHGNLFERWEHPGFVMFRFLRPTNKKFMEESEEVQDFQTEANCALDDELFKDPNPEEDAKLSVFDRMRKAADLYWLTKMADATYDGLPDKDLKRLEKYWIPDYKPKPKKAKTSVKAKKDSMMNWLALPEDK